MAAGLTAFALLCWLIVRYYPSKLDEAVGGVLIYLPILTIVLFQPEIRQAFISLGNRTLLRRRRKRFEVAVYDEIVLAATTMASTKTGALIVIERGVGLKEVIGTGVRLDAELSYDLLVSIFNPMAPLHDGAVVIRGYRIAAASCFFPLTLNPNISRDLGTRHRAAIGITEDTDAFAVVVSEETGLISITRAGQIRRGLDATKLRAAIQNLY
jgi:diadenylate cyclase